MRLHPFPDSSRSPGDGSTVTIYTQSQHVKNPGDHHSSFLSCPFLPTHLQVLAPPPPQLCPSIQVRLSSLWVPAGVCLHSLPPAHPPHCRRHLSPMARASPCKPSVAPLPVKMVFCLLRLPPSPPPTCTVLSASTPLHEACRAFPQAVPRARDDPFLGSVCPPLVSLKQLSAPPACASWPTRWT